MKYKYGLKGDIIVPAVSWSTTFFPVIFSATPWSGEILINGNPRVIFIALKLYKVFKGVKTWSWYIPKTTSYFLSRHAEDGTSNELSYKTGLDLAQSTGFQPLSIDQIHDNDSSMCGFLHLFNPSDTTFVKHFLCRTQQMQVDDSMENYSAGYFNTTSAIDAVQFKYASGNIDAGDICLYGIS